MRAAVYHGRRDVRIEDVPEPADPSEGEVTVEVEYASVCGTDVAEWAHGPTVTRNLPTVIGHEFVGRVVSTGGRTGLQVGDRIVCGSGVSCGRCPACRSGRTNLCDSYRTLGQQLDGGMGEFVTCPADICHLVPATCPPGTAVLAQPFAVALHAARRAITSAGLHVGVVGAGGIGVFAIAAARAFGALTVAVDIDGRRLSQARSLGAVTAEAAGGSVRDALLSATNGEGLDVVIETTGDAQVPDACLGAVRKGGTLMIVSLPHERVQLDLRSAVLREVDVLTSLAHVCDVDLPAALTELNANPSIGDTVVAERVPLERVVDRGLDAAHAGQQSGKVVVTIGAA